MGIEKINCNFLAPACSGSSDSKSTSWSMYKLASWKSRWIKCQKQFKINGPAENADIIIHLPSSCMETTSHDQLDIE